MCKEKHQYHNLPYEVISDAVCGDPGAMEIVQEHYKGYITELATTVKYDCYGCRHAYLNENLRRRLEGKLVTVTMRFRLD